MYFAPKSRVGRRAVVLMLILAAYSFAWRLFLLLPESWRAVRIGLAVLIPVLALAALVLAGVAIFRDKDHSVLLTVTAAVTLLVVLAFVIGEFVAPH